MGDPVTDDRVSQDPERPVYVISVAAELVRVHPRTLRIYELEGLVCPARTRSNIRLYSDNDIRRVLWIRHLTGTSASTSPEYASCSSSRKGWGRASWKPSTKIATARVVSRVARAARHRSK